MTVSIDEQFVEFVIKSLVSKPDEVKIERRIDEKGVLLELTVDPEDLGRVIGKRGATAQSVRTLLRALGTKNDARYNLKIIDNGEPRPRYEDRPDERHEDAPAPAEQSDEAPKKAEAPADEPVAVADDFSEDSEPAEEKPAETESDSDNKDDNSSVINKTRAELADLDDLDV